MLQQSQSTQQQLDPNQQELLGHLVKQIEMVLDTNSNTDMVSQHTEVKVPQKNLYQNLPVGFQQSAPQQIQEQPAQTSFQFPPSQPTMQDNLMSEMK